MENIVKPEITKLANGFLQELKNSQLDLNYQGNANPIVHNNVKCDGCGIWPLVGIRYKCTVCNNFDFCQICEAQKEHNHLFLKIRKPEQVPKHIQVVYDQVPQEQQSSQQQNQNFQQEQNQNFQQEQKQNFQQEQNQNYQQSTAQLNQPYNHPNFYQEQQNAHPYQNFCRRNMRGFGRGNRCRGNFFQNIGQFWNRLYNGQEQDITYNAQFTQMQEKSQNVFSPGQVATLSFGVKNTGQIAWDQTIFLQQKIGNFKAQPIDIPPLQPNEEGIISIQVTAPLKEKAYQGAFKLMTTEQVEFGSPLDVVFTVRGEQFYQKVFQIMELGFQDQSKIEKLLGEHDEDVDQVVNILFEEKMKV